jgi:hypothetical protein
VPGKQVAGCFKICENEPTPWWVKARSDLVGAWERSGQYSVIYFDDEGDPEPVVTVNEMYFHYFSTSRCEHISPRPPSQWKRLFEVGVARTKPINYEDFDRRVRPKIAPPPPKEPQQWYMVFQGRKLIHHPDESTGDDFTNGLPYLPRIGPFKTDAECGVRAAAEAISYVPKNFPPEHGYYQVICEIQYPDTPDVPQRDPIKFTIRDGKDLERCKQTKAKLKADPGIDQNYKLECREDDWTYDAYHPSTLSFRIRDFVKGATSPL